MAILYSWDVKMTALLEKIVSIIAPHDCVRCGIEDNVLCEACQPEVFLPLDSLCVFCQKPTVDWRTCQPCTKKYKIDSVWVAGEYKDLVSDVLRLYKFERVKAASKSLAQVLDNLLPYIEPGTLIIPLPTATNRVRQRGYDQSALLAQDLAKLRGIKITRSIARAKNIRQVGASRKQRFEQARLAYMLTKPKTLRGKKVWLVDDICTTGASLSAAARLVKAAGANEVHGVVVAWQKLG